MKEHFEITLKINESLNLEIKSSMLSEKRKKRNPSEFIFNTIIKNCLTPTTHSLRIHISSYNPAHSNFALLSFFLLIEDYEKICKQY